MKAAPRCRRLDYFIISERLKPQLCDSLIRSQVLGSDHCPVVLLMHFASDATSEDEKTADATSDSPADTTTNASATKETTDDGTTSEKTTADGKTGK